MEDVAPGVAIAYPSGEGQTADIEGQRRTVMGVGNDRPGCGFIAVEIDLDANQRSAEIQTSP